MSFKIKKVKSQTLGEFLRTCREKSGLSLSELAKFSQVQPKNILALEQGRFADLPAPVYVKGFLKSLSSVFHVPAEKLLVQYLAEQEVAWHLERTKAESQAPVFAAPKFIFSPKTLVIGSLIAFSFLSVFYLYFQMSSLKRSPRLDIVSPARDLTTNQAVLLLSGTTEPGSSIYLNNQQIVVDAQGEFRENLSLAPGSNLLTIRAVNKFEKVKSATRTIIYSEGSPVGRQEKAIAGAATASDGLLLEIVIEDQAAWISWESDGAERYTGTMLPHSRQKIVAREKIILTTGNAGTTRVILNGKDLGILGKEGEAIRDIEFTK